MKVTAQHVDGLRSLVTVGGHTIVVDPAPEEGGTGTAPSAPQLFVAAVAACMLEFVANSCRLHRMPLERLSVEVEFEERARPRRIDAMEATISIEPELTDEVKRRLIGVAKHATLVNTLVRPLKVALRFAEK